MTKSKILMASTSALMLFGSFAVKAEDIKSPVPIPAEHAEMYHNMMEKVDKVAGIYDKVMAKMHKAMTEVKVTGDADVDFVAGMIPHHQGAIDMAKVVLEKGKDPEIKKLAEGIIKAQESEIKLMNEWLATHKK